MQYFSVRVYLVERRTTARYVPYSITLRMEFNAEFLQKPEIFLFWSINFQQDDELLLLIDSVRVSKQKC